MQVYVRDKDPPQEGDPHFRFGTATHKKTGLSCNEPRDMISYETIRPGDSVVIRTVTPHGGEGQCYYTGDDKERLALAHWLSKGHRKDPYTNARIPESVADRITGIDSGLRPHKADVFHVGDHTTVRFTPFEKNGRTRGWQVELEVSSKHHTATAHFRSTAKAYQRADVPAFDETLQATKGHPEQYILAYQDHTVDRASVAATITEHTGITPSRWDMDRLKRSAQTLTAAQFRYRRKIHRHQAPPQQDDHWALKDQVTTRQKPARLDDGQWDGHYQDPHRLWAF